MKWHIYDFFNLAENQHWLSEDQEACQKVLKQLLPLIKAKFGLLKTNQWAVGEYIGGVIVQGSQAGLFRIYNGGRDHRERPNRWVLLAATGDLSEWRGIDVVEALESPVLRAFGITPVPEAAKLPGGSPLWSNRLPAGNAVPTPFDEKGGNALDRVRPAGSYLVEAHRNGQILVVNLAVEKRAIFACEAKTAADTEPTAQAHPPVRSPQANPPESRSLSVDRHGNRKLIVAGSLGLITAFLGGFALCHHLRPGKDGAQSQFAHSPPSRDNFIAGNEQPGEGNPSGNLAAPAALDSPTRGNERLPAAGALRAPAATTPFSGPVSEQFLAQLTGMTLSKSIKVQVSGANHATLIIRRDTPNSWTIRGDNLPK